MMRYFGAGESVYHPVHGYGAVVKRHKNGRYAVRFEGEQLPRTVDPADITAADAMYTGTDYE